MNISVILCTLNRPRVLHDTILSILRQELLPQEIIVAVPSLEHVSSDTLALPSVKLLITPVGLCKQRNRALEELSEDTEIVAFLDDDIELSTHYLKEMARLFTTAPEVIIASGRMLHDGGRGTRITREESIARCQESDRSYELRPLSFAPIDAGYGCNMICRYSSIKSQRFDERLPLYGWLEDRDFSYRCTVNRYPAVCLDNAQAVHLGWRNGRVSGVRLGFSTVVNPIYLKRKTKMFSFHFIFIHYWVRCLIGNLIGLITRDSDYDRRGLLQGNFRGFWHLLSGKCDPEHILNL
ncbi:MAG TPA: glycosyltransferase [Bryobacteraceae bacterium]|jgi:glycosyltransferase involved in cell wall biosynthesis|nr:glycosyltransferase [Bryobacteraceae bacterium]